MAIEFCTKYLPLVYSTQMANKYGLTPEFYVYDLKILSNVHYTKGMPVPALLLLEQWLKHFQAVIASLMLYDLVYHIPQQVSLSNCKQSFYISLLS